MKRALFIIPFDTTLESLTEEQQAAIASVHSQFTLPMPGSQVINDHKVVDGVVSDAFDPAVMQSLGLDWQLVGLFEWDGKSPNLTVLFSLDMDALYPYLAPTSIYDDEGNVVGTEPPARTMPANWAGWPEPEMAA